jgi:hypothetical protein
MAEIEKQNAMKEAFFSTETIRSVRYHGGWAYKIPDAPITKEILKITRFTNAKPCDIVCCFGMKFVAIETKQFKKWKALSKHDFRPEQIEGMTNIVNQGGRAFVFLNIRINTKELYENRLIIFDWKTWGPILSTGSVHAKELKERVYYSSFMVDEKRIFDLTEWLLLV